MMSVFKYLFRNLGPSFPALIIGVSTLIRGRKQKKENNKEYYVTFLCTTIILFTAFYLALAKITQMERLFINIMAINHIIICFAYIIYCFLTKKIEDKKIYKKVVTFSLEIFVMTIAILLFAHYLL